MFLYNSSSENFLFYIGSQDFVSLESGQTKVIDVNSYTGNESFQKQVDKLYADGKIVVGDAPIGFPLSVAPATVEESISELYEISDQDFIIYKADAASALAVDTTYEGVEYGSIKLTSSVGSEAGVCAAPPQNKDGMIYASKLSDQTKKIFDVRINGFRKTIDPSTATAEDVAQLLIDLGLADEA